MPIFLGDKLDKLFHLGPAPELVQIPRKLVGSQEPQPSLQLFLLLLLFPGQELLGVFLFKLELLFEPF